MKNRKNRIIMAVVAGTLLVGSNVYAAESVGAAGALEDKTYTLEEMLTYAIEDEYLAMTEYDMIMDVFGEQRPFSNIIEAEKTHISELEPLLKEYDVTLPDNDYESMIVVPDSLADAYAAGVEAEENNIEMYERFLEEDIPSDVEAVFEELKSASENHLAAFSKERGVGAGSFGYSSRNVRDNGYCNGEGGIENGLCDGSCELDYTGNGIGNGSGYRRVS